MQFVVGAFYVVCAARRHSAIAAGFTGLLSLFNMTRAQLDALDKPTETAERNSKDTATQVSMTPTGLVYAAWVPVAVPLLWAVFVTLQKATLIFSHG